MRYLLALIIPPFAVLLCGRPIQAFLNCFLTLLFWFPGAIHAVMVVHQEQADERHRQMLSVMSGKPIARDRPEVSILAWIAVPCLIVFLCSVVFTLVTGGLQMPTQPTPTAQASPAPPKIMGWPMAKVIAAYGEPASKDATTGLAHWPAFYARFENGTVTEISPTP